MQTLFGGRDRDQAADDSRGASHSQQAASEDAKDGNTHDSRDDEGRQAQEENAENNPMVQLLLGGMLRPQTAALHVTVRPGLRGSHLRHPLCPYG